MRERRAWAVLDRPTVCEMIDTARGGKFSDSLPGLNEMNRQSELVGWKRQQREESSLASQTRS